MDSWFLWYYLLHGNSGAIAWPEGWFHKKEDKTVIDAYILTLKDVFKTVQRDISQAITGPGSQFVSDPIGIYYSHASVQAGWVMDALVHGKTWPSRLSSIDNDNQSSGVLRKVWCKSIEDVGLQYDFINYIDIVRGRMDLNDRFKVIILPKTICLSDKEADILKRYVEKGGVLIADYLCGIFDEHGKFREKGALDDLFGINRDDRAGYLNGKGVTEINAEKYKADFSDRFTFYKGADYFNHLVMVERGTIVDSRQGRSEVHQVFQKQKGLGRAYYLNLSPLEYWGSKKRFSDYGNQWRGIISDIFEEAGVLPKIRVRVQGQGGQTAMIEALFWKNGEDLFLGLIKNPTDMVNDPGTPDAEPIRITIQFKNEVALFDMKNQKSLGRGKEFSDDFNPWEANLYQVF